MDSLMTRVIFPEYTNHHKTLFGGQALKWMDELAFIAVSRNFHKDFVTVKISSVRFIKPILQNAILELNASIKSVGKVKLEVQVQGFVIIDNIKELAIDGIFSLAPVNEKMQPIRL